MTCSISRCSLISQSLILSCTFALATLVTPHVVSAQAEAASAATVAELDGRYVDLRQAPIAAAGYVDSGCDSCTTCGDDVVDGGCGCGDGNCRFTTFWGFADYMGLWEKGRNLPPLATSNSNLDTPREAAGVLGLGDTSVVYGNERIEQERNGGRITFGAWWDQCTNCGIGVSYVGTEEATSEFRGDSSSFPILGRPFFNVFDDREDALLMNYPDEFEGDLNITTTSEMHSFEVFTRRLSSRGCNFRVDWLLGYRYAQLDESLAISDTLEFLRDTNLIQAGTVISNHDLFDVKNEYHSVMVGLWSQKRDGPWSLDVITKLALGNMNHKVTTNGSTVTNAPGQDPVQTVGGLLTQRSNIGSFDADNFAVMPELSLTVGYQVTAYLDVTFGYTIMYWSRIVQPGDLVDHVVDLTQQINSPTAIDRPAMIIRDTDYWLQGLTVGVNFRF